MKLLSKLASAVILLVLMTSAFPAMGVNTVHAATCDWALFIADVTVPDGTTYAPGATFRKTWRLKNIGSCTWTTSYALVFDSGERMGAPAAINFPTSVAPGQTVDLSLDLTAPSTAGHYFGYWKLRNASGTIFGIGSTANKAFWVEIYVAASAGVAYDFTANASSAAWSSGAGGLPYPGSDGDSRGFVLKKDNPTFESGLVMGVPGLLTAPQNVYNGYIQGVYPAVRVQSGDRFQATIGCDYGATNCYVAYRLDYQIGSGAVRTFWTFREKYEGYTYNVNLNLNSLAGQDVKFILFISAYGSAPGDRALWGYPILSRAGGGTIPTFTPTVTGTPPTVVPTVPPSSCDRAQFIADVTVPDGTIFAPGTPFTKTWRLKNVGTCSWTTAYQLVFYSGEKMGGPDALFFPTSVVPGQTVDLTISLTAPNVAGTYRGNWMFKNASGALFGIGSQANKPWWVEIKAVGASITNTPVSATPSATPSATATATATATPTGTLPSPTATPTGTQPSPTYTSTQPTSTPTYTLTVPTSTYTGTPPTSTPTYTGTPPTATPTYTMTQPTPTYTGTPPSPTPTPTLGTPGSACDKAEYVADVTVPDGTIFAPGTAFTKTWRLKNVGTCTWTTSYSVAFLNGEQMSGPASINLPSSVAPGETIDLSVNLTAPAINGTYRGYWMLKNAGGTLFGIGTSGDKPFWVEIKVSGSAGGTTAYDFVANFCSAQWLSGSGILPCPTAYDNVNGFVLSQNTPTMENGLPASMPGLLTQPQKVYNGYIQGVYPEFVVQSGDRFQSVIGCEYNFTACYVTYRLDYQVGNGPIQTFWTFREAYEGLSYQADFDLSPLAGQNVKFILRVMATGSADGDHAYWVGTKIFRP